MQTGFLEFTTNARLPVCIAGNQKLLKTHSLCLVQTKIVLYVPRSLLLAFNKISKN